MEATMPNNEIKVNKVKKVTGNFILSFTCLVIVSYIVFGNAMTFNIGNRLPVKVSELLSIPLIMIYVFRFKKIHKKVHVKYPRLFILWCILDLVSIMTNVVFMNYTLKEFAYGTIYLMRLIHIVLVSFVSVALLRYYKVSLKKIRNLIIYSYIIVCLIGIAQYFLFPVVEDWYNFFYKFKVYWPTPDPHLKRIVSTYFDPNYLASILIIPIMIDLSLLVFGKKRFVSVKQLLIELGILGITLLMTKSRSGIVGLFIGAFIILSIFVLTKRIKLRYYLLILIAGIVAIYLLLFSDITVFERIRTFKDDASAAHRFDSWSESLIYIKNNPILGVGYNLFGSYTEKITGALNQTTGYGVDSSFLLLLITTGFIGGGLFLYASVRYLLKRNKSPLHIAIKAILVASFVMSFFNNLLFNVLWIMPVCLLIFLNDSYSCRREKKNV